MTDTALDKALADAEAFLADPAGDAGFSTNATPEERLAYTGGLAHGHLEALVEAVRKAMPEVS
ncbi:hypothetical protein OG897_13430 [Streptomyces sp. NBC_00237]|uniref:hypothetical protein n=1 Tax=Streptomyces sp. NBC_00237 TaxID=2975687 RepID=UPI00225C2AB1|nr:hypothetical protein [Streptomyces sp. NBC_00237]MCX5202445.1 hypothetical protein [Streptomyces sp. NBC_00237]